MIDKAFSEILIRIASDFPPIRGLRHGSKVSALCFMLNYSGNSVVAPDILSFQEAKVRPWDFAPI